MSNNGAFFNYDTTANGIQQFLQGEDDKYKVFTGADLVAYIGNIPIGKLQGITCSITRETMPIYVTGDPNCKAFAKGKRGIAGSLVFTQFDKHAILRDLINTSNKKLQNLWSALNPATNLGSTVPANILVNNPATDFSGNISNILSGNNGALVNGTTIAQRDVLETAYLVANRKINYVDQIPPFDVTVTFVNETGNAAAFAIHGCQLVNEGFGFSLDDLHSETAYTYLARAVSPMEALGDPGNLGPPGTSPGTLSF